MLAIKDRVLETSSTSGNGPMTLSGPVTGHHAFSEAWVAATQVYYCIEDGTNWEVGEGTFTPPSTLSRTTVLDSSAGGAKVVFPSGEKRVFNVAPAVILSQVPYTLGSNAWGANQYIAPVTLTSASTVTIAAGASNNFRLVLGTNVTLANPTGLVNGMVINLMVVQDSTGGRTLAFGSKFKFPEGVVQPPAATPGSISLYSFYYDSVLDVLLTTSQKGYA